MVDVRCKKERVGTDKVSPWFSNAQFKVSSMTNDIMMGHLKELNPKTTHFDH